MAITSYVLVSAGIGVVNAKHGEQHSRFLFEQFSIFTL